MITGSDKICIGIQPMGEVQQTFPKAVAAAFLVELGIRTTILPPLEHPFYAYDQRRIQYNAATIITKLEAINFGNCTKVIALLDVDLFIPVFTYVFGESRQGGNHALVSLFRLKDSLERAVKVALHEFGHLCNLSHCTQEKCLMNFSRGIEDLDDTSLYFCKYCTEYIRYEFSL